MELLGLFYLWLIVWGIRKLIKRGRERRRRFVEYIRSFDPKPVLGDASFASYEYLAATGVLEKGPIVAGYTKSDKPTAIYYNPEEGQYKPIVTFGGMGSLKTTSMHIPFSLRWNGSLLLLEATGETAITTAHYRLRYGPVSIINLSASYRASLLGLPEVSYNRLAPYWLNANDPAKFDTRASGIGSSCTEKQVSRDPYWDLTAGDVIEVVVMCEAELVPLKACIGRVADIISEDPIGYIRWALERIRNPRTIARCRRYIGLNAEQVKSLKEVIQNACTQLKPFMTVPALRSLSRSDVTFGSLRQRRQTIIIINSLENIGAQSTDRLRTFLLESALAEWQSEQFAGPIPAAMVVDEAGQYGNCQPLEMSMSSLRKYNCFPVVAVNDYSTLRKHYGEGASTFINNAGLVQFMSVKDVPGSEMLSSMLGQCEARTSGKTVNLNPNYDWSKPSKESLRHIQMSESHSVQARPLLLPHEIRELGPRDEIIFMDGVRGPILATKKPYFETELKRLARPNLYHRRKHA